MINTYKNTKKIVYHFNKNGKLQILSCNGMAENPEKVIPKLSETEVIPVTVSLSSDGT